MAPGLSIPGLGTLSLGTPVQGIPGLDTPSLGTPLAWVPLFWLPLDWVPLVWAPLVWEPPVLVPPVWVFPDWVPPMRIPKYRHPQCWYPCFGTAGTPWNLSIASNFVRNGFAAPLLIKLPLCFNPNIRMNDQLQYSLWHRPLMIVIRSKSVVITKLLVMFLKIYSIYSGL